MPIGLFSFPRDRTRLWAEDLGAAAVQIVSRSHRRFGGLDLRIYRDRHASHLIASALVASEWTRGLILNTAPLYPYLVVFWGVVFWPLSVLNVKRTLRPLVRLNPVVAIRRRKARRRQARKKKERKKQIVGQNSEIDVPVRKGRVFVTKITRAFCTLDCASCLLPPIFEDCSLFFLAPPSPLHR